MPHLNLIENPQPPQQTKAAEQKVHQPQVVQPINEVSKDKVSELLKEAGIGKGAKKKSVKELLAEYDIGSEDAIELLSGIAHRGESDAIRLRAIDTALKLGGDLVETQQVPSVIININGDNTEVNPILVPRII